MVSPRCLNSYKLSHNSQFKILLQSKFFPHNIIVNLQGRNKGGLESCRPIVAADADDLLLPVLIRPRASYTKKSEAKDGVSKTVINFLQNTLLESVSFSRESRRDTNVVERNVEGVTNKVASIRFISGSPSTLLSSGVS